MVIVFFVVFFALAIFIKLKMPMWKGKYSEKLVHKEMLQLPDTSAKTSIKQGICPQCGGQLVLRQGRYGSFYGCDNYPKCKFTLNK